MTTFTAEAVYLPARTSQHPEISQQLTPQSVSKVRLKISFNPSYKVGQADCWSITNYFIYIMDVMLWFSGTFAYYFKVRTVFFTFLGVESRCFCSIISQLDQLRTG